MSEEKSVGIAYLAWLFLGIIGAHKLYLGRPLMALLYLCTAGIFIVGWLSDLFTLKDQVEAYNDNLYDELEDSFEYQDYLEERVEELEDEVMELRTSLKHKPGPLS